MLEKREREKKNHVKNAKKAFKNKITCGWIGTYYKVFFCPSS
jgi:hypothetical protein